MKKVIINKKHYGNIELPKSRNAYNQFIAVVRAFPSKNSITLRTIYTQEKLDSFEQYQKGGCEYELRELDMFIELGRILNFTTSDAKKLKEHIEFTSDNAHVNLSIVKSLKLFNKETPTPSKNKYLFWDIENFSNISPMFFDIIEPFEIEDKDIYISCNPDSLYLFKSQWEADFYDFSKTFNSFNFTKCDHGANVADGVLLKNFQELNAVNSDIYLMTYDRELKERFTDACDDSNNLYAFERKIL